MVYFCVFLGSIFRKIHYFNLFGNFFYSMISNIYPTFVEKSYYIVIYEKDHHVAVNALCIDMRGAFD